MKKRLIITGHDLGLTPAVNAGFEYLTKGDKKLFSELSLIPNSPYSEQAISIAKKSNISTNLCISLVSNHLKSLSQSESLISEAGMLKTVPNVSSWDFSVLDTYSQSDIEQEIEAQYQWFINNFGCKPSALVTQKGEHGDPKVLEPLINLAKRENLPMRAPLWQWQANYGAQSLVESEGIKTTSKLLVGFKDWQKGTGFDLEKDYLDLVELADKKGVTELLFLPGFCDQTLFDMTSISWQRGQILAIYKRKYELIERIYNEFDVITYQDL